MTVVGWMLYVVLVGATLAFAAWLVEQGASRFRLPLRWIWAGALSLGVLIPISNLLGPAPFGTGAEMGHMEGSAWMGPPGPAEGEGIIGAAGPLAWGEGIIQAVNRALQGASDAVAHRGHLDTLLGWGWAGASLFLVGLLVAGGLRLRQRSRHWIPMRLAQGEFLVAPTAGPAVGGVIRPRIVIPARYRQLGPDELHLILQHEAEHVRARDPLLLTASLIPLIAAPWNPFFWWSFRRLRAAMEVDCDRRVLARGARPARYGALLLKMGRPQSSGVLPALSLAGAPSTLERRLNAMRNSSTRNALPVSIICGALAVGAMVLACQADTPTAPSTGEGVQQEVQQETPISEAPAFTPFTIAPEVLNRSEVAAALQREYPRDLREAGIGGTIIMHLFIDETGVVQNTLVAESSGQTDLDAAAGRVAGAFEFSPAMNRDERVPVWIQIPITFTTR